MIHLRNLWADPLRDQERVRFHTSFEPGMAGGIACVEIDGISATDLQRWLWQQHRIHGVSIVHRDPETGEEVFQGVRISPSVYTTPTELARFSEAMDHALRQGVAG